MQKAQTCAECGSPIPENAREGYCPKCLLALANTTAVVEAAELQLASPLPPGSPVSSFGSYQLIEIIGEGGMGVVYKARQRTLDRIVALKMMRSGSLASESEVKRFRSEAQAVARLQHPNVVAIHEVGEQDGQFFFSMDYIEGKNLAEVIRRTPLSPERAARYVKTIAEATHYAHERGILHRDLKPANVLIDASDQPRITDFGLAKHIETDSDLTVSGAVMGTPSYMPPEQAAGRRKEIGLASDVYSLGAILYDLLTGRPPFRADTPVDTLRQVLDTEPAPPRLLNAKVPRDLETICLKCLAKEPGQRYSSAQELADDLGRFLRREPIQARPVGRLGRLGRWCRRNPVIAGFSGATGSLLLMLALAAVLFRSDAKESNAQTAWYAAGMIRSELSQLGIAVNEVASSAELPDLIAANDTNALSIFLEDRLQKIKTITPAWLSSQNWVIMTPEGRLVVRWPDAGNGLLTNRSGRNYFTGAVERADRDGIDAVYISHVYQSVEDHLFKFGVSRAIRNPTGKTNGVVALMVNPVNFTQALGLTNDQREILIIGEWDSSTEFTPTNVPSEFKPLLSRSSGSITADKPDFVVLFHPAFGTNNLVVPVFHPGDSRYRNPFARMHREFAGRWLVKFAPVEDTPFTVVYQSRDRVTDALVVVAVVAALAALFFVGWRLFRRRANARTGRVE